MYTPPAPGSFAYYAQRLRIRLGLDADEDTGRSYQVRRFSQYVVDHLASDSLWLAVPQGTMTVRVMNRIHERTRADYVTWIMDDHAIAWNGGWRYPDGFEEEFARHLRCARQVFVISPAMGQLYRDRFGVSSDVLFSPTDLVDPPVYDSPRPTGPISLCYFGAIREWQRDALEHVISWLPAIDGELDVFTFGDAAVLPSSDRVHIRPPIAGTEVTAMMRNYDAVIIPVSFRDACRGLSALNISTKLSECLASGTAVVVVGPHDSAMVEFIRAHEAGVTISDVAGPTPFQPLMPIKTRAVRARLIDNAQRAVESTCSVEIMRGRWAAAWPDSTVGGR
jgi:hypothetical protein